MAPFLGANGFRVYCPDMPAFGLTEDPEDAYAFGDGGHADFVHDFVNAVCVDQFHISGNSMGCSNTVNYVTAHPERILSYALIAGGIGDIVPMAEMMAADPRPADARPNISSSTARPSRCAAMMEAIIYRAGAISDDLIAMRTSAANHHREAYTKRMQMMMAENGPGGTPDTNKAARMSTKGRFDKMTIPGIYLYGRQDVLISHEAGYLQEDKLSQRPVLLSGRDRPSGPDRSARPVQSGLPRVLPRRQGLVGDGAGGGHLRTPCPEPRPRRGPAGVSA